MKSPIFAIALLLTSLCPALFAETVGPWDLDALKTKVPAMKWLRQDQPIQSLTYAGENYQGRETDVFAFYASPITLGEARPGEKFPAVVLVHGGGGTAFAEWVRLWAKRGYAAIAMDLTGSRPPDPAFDPKTGRPLDNRRRGGRKRLPNGGPPEGRPEKFDCILTPDPGDDWPFHAAASVMRAHTLLRGFPEVDAERTAVTGISWGGYTTCLVASLDDRFKAAVPVYGCGFLHEGESVQKSALDKLDPEHRAMWVKQYDPGSLLPRCRVPILFVNGTNDVHYPLDSYMKSYNVVPGEKHLRIQIKMPHGHQQGWAPKEIGLFIDSKCRGGKPLPVMDKPRIEGDQVKVWCGNPSLPPLAKFKQAALHYTTGNGLRSEREWTSVPATISEAVPPGGGNTHGSNEITAPRPPAGANTWFLTLTDERDAMVGTVVEFAK